MNFNMTDIKLIYLFIVCFILAVLYKITTVLENAEDEAITKKDIPKLLGIGFIYGVFGGIIGLSFFLGVEYYVGLDEFSRHLQYLTGLISGMVGTIGTVGIKILHRFIERKVSNV